MDVYTNAWAKKSCGFTVERTDNVISVHKKEQTFSIEFLNERYEGNYNDLGAFREWGAKYGLIIMVCPAPEYWDNHIDILQIRNLMHEKNRKNDSILFLTRVEDMMECVGEYRSDIEKAVAIYSALTDYPYSNKTKLKEPTFLLPLYGEASCRYMNHDTGNYFAMPVNLVCDLECASAYEIVLADMINRVTRERGMRISMIGNNLFNKYLVMKSFNKLLGIEGKEIRLAVVGVTAAGKTYFLEDVVHLLSRRDRLDLTTTDTKDSFRPFGNFIGDATSPGYKLTSATPKYACRHKNHYSSFLVNKSNKKFRFSFLDIPGEVIKDEESEVNGVRSQLKRYSLCKQLFDGIKSTKTKIFIEKTWTDDKGNKMKTVEYDDGKDFVIPKYDENNNSYTTQSINTVRSESYAEKEDVFAWMKEKFKGFKQKAISGKEFIENYYDYDSDSAYNALVDLFPYLPNLKIDLGITQDIYKEHVAYNFYFYCFLFQATDVVLLSKVINGKKDDEEDATWFNNSMYLKGLKQDNPEIRFYLGIKGADTFFDKSKFENYYKLLNQSNAVHNIMYSAAAVSVGKYLTGDSNPIQPDIIAPNNNSLSSTPCPVGIVKMDNNAKQAVSDAIDIFKGIVGADVSFNVPRHTYFIASPIDNKYEINEFQKEGIRGRSKNPDHRCYFGSLQLIEDIMKERDKKLCESYEATGEFLKFIRGTDSN
jgi:hypothetical protein